MEGSYLKKGIAVCIAIVLVLVCTACQPAQNDVKEIMYKELISALPSSDSASNLTLDYIGQYGDSHVGILTGGTVKSKNDRVYLYGMDFIYPTDHQIQVYRYGKSLVSLESACNDGWLTVDDVGAIFEIYQKAHAELYPKSPVELDSGLKAELQSAYYSLFMSDDVKQLDDLGASGTKLPSKYSVAIQYYGKFGDKHVAFYNDSVRAYPDEIRNEEYGELVFQYPSGQQLLVYRNGEFKNLADAYASDWFTADEMSALHTAYANSD